MPNSTRNHEERFWARVDKSGGPEACWRWMGAKTKDGYGHFRNGSAFIYAHRFSCEQTHGPLPAGYCACHRCDTPACCNPAHLFAGTMAVNMADRDEKGRGRGKFTRQQVREIRELHKQGRYLQKDIARRFGAEPYVISRIVANKTYRSEAT